MQRFQGRNLRRQKPDRSGQGSALIVEVGAKSSHRSAHKTEVHTLVLLQLLRLRCGQQREQQASNVLDRHGRSRVRRQGSVDAQCSRGAGDENEVGGMAIEGCCQELVHRSLLAGLCATCGAIELIDNP